MLTSLSTHMDLSIPVHQVARSQFVFFSSPVRNILTREAKLNVGLPSVVEPG